MGRSKKFDHRANRKKWVSASQLYSYMRNDPICDWIKLYGNDISTNKFVSFVMAKGVIFERDIVRSLKTRLNEKNKPPVIVSSNAIYSDDSVAKTLKLMKQGVPIIHSASVMNRDNKTYGVVDLLVRSDKLHLLSEINPLHKYQINHKAPLLNGKYHYIVIDIKYSTLPLATNGRHIINSGSYRSYKAQVWIYTQAIGKMQGYTSNIALLLGRKWKFTSRDTEYKGVTNYNIPSGEFILTNRFGVVDFALKDYDLISTINSGIEWIKDVQQNGETWDINKPHRWEMYPNMCVDTSYSTIKQKIALNIGEITSVWYCGFKNREIAFSNGIYSIFDKKCSSKTLGIEGQRANTIDAIININRQSDIKILPKKLSMKNANALAVHSDLARLYVDFETLNDIFIGNEYIFMIGIGYIDEGKWCYKCLRTNDLSHDEELRIMTEFCGIVSKYKLPRIYHWSPAEQVIWGRAINRHSGIAKKCSDNGYIYDFTDIWFDLCQVFISEPIIINGCFDYRLKSVASAMKKSGIIDDQWNSCICSGTDAMVSAWEYYTKESPSTIMDDIVEYNNADCRIMWRILNYIHETMV